MKAANTKCWLALAAAWACACASLAAQGSTPVPAAETTHTVYLQYQETDRTIISWDNFSSRAVPFAGEPDFGRRPVFRGSLTFGNNPEYAMPYVWDSSQAKLYLDLNRNGNLTDDPLQVLSSRAPAIQTFTNIHLNFDTPAGPRRLLVDLTLYPSGVRGATVYVSCRSFWTGKISLHGRDWQVGLIENVSGQIRNGNRVIQTLSGGLGSAEGGYMLLRPWEFRDQPINLQDGSLDTFCCGPYLFFGQQTYEVHWAWVQQDGAPKLKLELKECPTGMGDLELAGKFIRRLILAGSGADQPTPKRLTVVLDTPEPMVKIPAGAYSQYQIELEAGGETARRSAQLTPPLVISTNQAVALKVGGPLTNTLTVIPGGDSLTLVCQLVGIEAAPYQMRQDVNQPPRWTVYRKGEAIDAGRFRFG